uniref:Uncharacterized protein n=1 Tax=Romanomermis culicivorax TaxID=13658 RepID=A0A915JWS9_ROMCU
MDNNNILELVPDSFLGVDSMEKTDPVEVEQMVKHIHSPKWDSVKKYGPTSGIKRGGNHKGIIRK